MKPNIKVIKLTNLEMLREMLQFVYGMKESKQTLGGLYSSDHSTMRSQLFLVFMKDIPTKVSVHLVRHSGAGQYHLVGSNRADWNGVKGAEDAADWDGEVNRNTPVNHVMILNGGHLIDMARKRLCGVAEKATREIMFAIKAQVSLDDPDLAAHMVRNCVYRNGICPEGSKSCGYNYKVLRELIGQVPEAIYRDARTEVALAEQNKLEVN